MFRSFGRRVAMCCDMLGVVGSSWKMVKFEPTTPNMSQHIATPWPNERNKLRPTMLQYVALACCDRLAGALILSWNPHEYWYVPLTYVQLNDTVCSSIRWNLVDMWPFKWKPFPELCFYVNCSFLSILQNEISRFLTLFFYRPQISLGYCGFSIHLIKWILCH